MNTMHMLQTTEPLVDVLVEDDAIEAFFAAAGLPVTVVAHCGDAACTTCFGRVPARAA